MNVTFAFSIDAFVTPSRAIVMMGTSCALAPFIDASGPPCRAITITCTCCNESQRDLAVIMAIKQFNDLHSVLECHKFQYLVHIIHRMLDTEFYVILCVRI